MRNQQSPMLLNWLRAHIHEGPLADRLAASAVAAANTNAIAIAIAGAGVGTGARTKRYTEEIRRVVKEIERVLGLRSHDSPEGTEEGGDEAPA